jgi:hypothetical protein
MYWLKITVTLKKPVGKTLYKKAFIHTINKWDSFLSKDIYAKLGKCLIEAKVSLYKYIKKGIEVEKQRQKKTQPGTEPESSCRACDP